jgi:GT2 family glycosyltransferase
VSPPTLSVVIVSFNSRADLERTIPALLAEIGPGDELIVADNASDDGSAECAGELAPEAKVIAMGSNAGFEAACNAAAARASGELLVLLNPDAMPLPGFGDAIRRPLLERRGWSAWMGLVTCEGGSKVNTSGNPVHFTGLAWAGGHGGPASERFEPGEVAAASGACLAVSAEVWRRQQGFPERFFLYHEDIDFSMRLHLAGELVGLEPGARVDHDYEFGTNPLKWRWLERNRLAFVLRVYPLPLLLLVAPALFATELALIPVSISGGWFRQKILSWADLVRWAPRLLRERRRVQATKRVRSGEFAAWLTADLDSPFFGRVGRNVVVRAALRAYWRIVKAILRAPRPAGSSA